MEAILVHEEKFVGPTAMLVAFEQMKKTKGVPAVVVLPRKKEKPMEKSDIADLLNFTVPEMTPEQLAAEKKQAEERKANTQALADKIAKAKAELEKIEVIPDWDINPDLVSQREGILAFLDKVEVSGDEAFKASLAVSSLINRIKAANPQRDAEVEVELHNVANEGRGEIRDAKDLPTLVPEGVVRFKNLYLLHKKSKIHPDKVASPADQTIFRELRALISRYLKTADSKKMEDLKKSGNPSSVDFKAKKPGIYKVYFPYRKNSKGKIWEEGCGLVELVNLNKTGNPFFVVKIINGAGSLHKWANHKNEWLPLAAAFTGKLLEEKTLAALLKTLLKDLNFDDEEKEVFLKYALEGKLANISFPLDSASLASVKEALEKLNFLKGCAKALNAVFCS